MKPKKPAPYKLYVWTEVVALKDYANGQVVVHAKSRQEAIHMAALEWRRERDTEAYAELRKELEAKKPKVFRGAKCLLTVGSA